MYYFVHAFFFPLFRYDCSSIKSSHLRAKFLGFGSRSRGEVMGMGQTAADGGFGVVVALQRIPLKSTTVGMLMQLGGA